MKHSRNSSLPGCLAIFVVGMLCLGSVPAEAADVPSPPPLPGVLKVYMVTFGVTIEEEGHIQKLRVEKIQDLLSGSRNPVDLDLPAPFLSMVRKRVEAEKFPSNPVESLVSFLHVPSGGRESSASGALHPGLLDGAMAMISRFKLDDEDWEAATYDKNLGSTALFLTWYALPAPARTSEARMSAVERELRRGLANIQGSLVSREVVPSEKHGILDCVAAHPRTDKLRVYQRTVCDDTQLFSTTFIGPAMPEPKQKEEMRALFDAMLFR